MRSVGEETEACRGRRIETEKPSPLNQPPRLAEAMGRGCGGHDEWTDAMRGSGKQARARSSQGKRYGRRERRRVDLQAGPICRPIPNHYVKPPRGLFDRFCKGEGVKHLVL